ncbi:uncharacterized protein LOC117100904 [Anneissia japonica]|uniref:uncharacterized protein LOC117100904 n=1 Tax=Anneissia japonica TaxID=1529436 RepID=UPI00142558E2|nr:uncharacterized protein LOC117100904 [Anneissia japonica]
MMSSFFAIENSLPFARSNAFNIMNQILKFAKRMVRKLPLKWLLVQQEIQKLKVEHIYLPTKEVIALVERCGVQIDAQMVLLEYLYDLGEILYFPDDDALKDIMFKTTIIRRKIFNAPQLTKEDEPSPIVCTKVIFLETELKIFCQSGARGVELTRYIACDCRNAHLHIAMWKQWNGNDALPPTI